mmetsp:Transcript_23018/g.30603  ORF Transcript_23018/g.30603 Transcript_23018/m.30603 type:complete len:143 (+) Transcript_23018:272-700(+)
MVCDRASNAMIYMILAALWTQYSFAFYFCLLLDFGSHWLQFQSSALSKTHHKGKNQKENWLVSLYYNNPMVFQIVVPGAELGTAGLYVLAQSDTLAANAAFVAVTALLTAILVFKMFVNVHQWFGAINRLEAYDLERRSQEF